MEPRPPSTRPRRGDRARPTRRRTRRRGSHSGQRLSSVKDCVLNQNVDLAEEILGTGEALELKREIRNIFDNDDQDLIRKVINNLIFPLLQKDLLASFAQEEAINLLKDSDSDKISLGAELFGYLVTVVKKEHLLNNLKNELQTYSNIEEVKSVLADIDKKLLSTGKEDDDQELLKQIKEGKFDNVISGFKEDLKKGKVFNEMFEFAFEYLSKASDVLMSNKVVASNYQKFSLLIIDALISSIQFYEKNKEEFITQLKEFLTGISLFDDSSKELKKEVLKKIAKEKESSSEQKPKPQTKKISSNDSPSTIRDNMNGVSNQNQIFQDYLKLVVQDENPQLLSNLLEASYTTLNQIIPNAFCEKIKSLLKNYITKKPGTVGPILKILVEKKVCLKMVFDLKEFAKIKLDPHDYNLFDNKVKDLKDPEPGHKPPSQPKPPAGDPKGTDPAAEKAKSDIIKNISFGLDSFRKLFEEQGKGYKEAFEAFQTIFQKKESSKIKELLKKFVAGKEKSISKPDPVPPFDYAAHVFEALYYPGANGLILKALPFKNQGDLQKQLKELVKGKTPNILKKTGANKPGRGEKPARPSHRGPRQGKQLQPKKGLQGKVGELVKKLQELKETLGKLKKQLGKVHDEIGGEFKF